MWIYNKTLQYPMRVSGKDIRMARNVITQYGGADGELGASLRYLTQRFNMPFKEGKAILTDIGISYSQCSMTSSTVNFAINTCENDDLADHCLLKKFEIFEKPPKYYSNTILPKSIKTEEAEYNVDMLLYIP